MLVLDKKTVKMLFFSVMLSYAGDKTVKQECPCDSLMQRFPEHVRHLVKEGKYYFDDKIFYKKRSGCFEMNNPDTTKTIYRIKDTVESVEDTVK